MYWRFFILYLLLLLGAFRPLHSAEVIEQSPRALVHLLDYLASDYAGAVANGKILNQDEYTEQQEFAVAAINITKSLSKDIEYKTLFKDLETLKALINRKAGPEQVAALANKLKSAVLKISKIPMAPTTWPSLAAGQKIFETRCATCHGTNGEGNGPAAAALDPKPRNLMDEAFMKEVSAFHAFNVVKLGIPGTAMVALPDLSEQDVWNVSFYALSMRAAKNPVAVKAPALSLEEVATHSDSELQAKVSGNDEEKKLQIAALRLKSGDSNDSSSLDIARRFLGDAEKSYVRGNHQEARKFALAAYLEGIEPVEPQLRGLNSKLTADLERAMAMVRSNIEKAQPVEILKTSIASAEIEITKAEAQLQSRDSSFWVTFSMAAGIVFREGFEAILILIAILGVIRAASAKRAAIFVHGGWVAAVLIGVLAWFFSGWMLVISGAQRELSEGIGSLFAVVVLLYMGFWLHSKTEIRKWTSFINGKVRSALEGSSRWGLFALSFVAVFREALETVLFMRALTLEGNSSSEMAMFSGVVFSFLGIFILAWAFLKFSVNLPVRTLFAVSSWMMVALSVILIGKGTHSFQEMGFLKVSLVSIPQFPLLGIFPSIETLAAQAVTLVGCCIIWLWMSRSSARISN